MPRFLIAFALCAGCMSAAFVAGVLWSAWTDYPAEFWWFIAGAVYIDLLRKTRP